MRPEEIFTEQEMREMRESLASFRTPGAYEKGKWMVSPLNRSIGTAQGRFPRKVLLRDITLRTMEQMPGVVLSHAERLEFLRELAAAGVPEIIVSSFRRGHTQAEMEQEVAVAKAAAADCRLVYCNAVKEEEMKLAADTGYDIVQIWLATYLGKAIPASAGAVYHRVWQGKDWHDLRFPRSPEEHIGRARRLVAMGVKHGVKVSALLNLLVFATEDYVQKFCEAMRDEGAFEIVLTDSTGGCSPETIGHLVGLAKSVSGNTRVGVHTHNIFGLAVATSIAGARAGAEMVELSVNGYEMGPAGTQASLAATAVALEALYGAHTGIDLSRMMHIARLGEKFTGVPLPWSEPVLGSGSLEASGADEYLQEAKFDPLIHCALEPHLVGAEHVRKLGASTGPMGMRDKLLELGLDLPRDKVEAVRLACLKAMQAERRELSDAEIRALAARAMGS